MELAGVVGVTQAAVSNWLKGSIPKGDQLLVMARALGVTMEWLLTGSAPKYPGIAIWKDGFFLATGEDDYEPEELEDAQDTDSTQKTSRVRYFKFEFLPPDHALGIPLEQQRLFYEKFKAAPEAERLEMLSLRGDVTRLFTTRILTAFETTMRLDLAKRDKKSAQKKPS